MPPSPTIHHHPVIGIAFERVHLKDFMNYTTR